ncbi:MAG TPA: DUF3168 domain-containing protein [Symbiobacteriaceae bacterium]|jgi:hypothetical protein
MSTTTEEALYTYLTGYPGLKSLVADRIYPLVMPEAGTLPAITFSQISGEHEYAHDGPAGLVHKRFQISCWAMTYLSAKSVSNQVKAALSGYVGLMGDLYIQASFVEDQPDLYDGETRVYHCPVDVFLWHAE